MGSDSFLGLRCGEGDEVEAKMPKGEESFRNLEKRRILEFGGVHYARGVARGLELCGKDSKAMEMKGTVGVEGFICEDEISWLEFMGLHLLGDLEKGFAEDDEIRCRESGISHLDIKKKWSMLGDLECGHMSGVVSGAQVPENEDASEGALLHSDGAKKVWREVCAPDSRKMKGSEGRNEGSDLGRSLKIKVIDDTAVIEQVPIREFHSMVKKEISIPTGPMNQKEVADGERVAERKKARCAWGKAKSLYRSEKMMLGKQENGNYHSQKSEAGRRLTYSFKEMEAMRFVNVIEQWRFWRRVYDGLGPVAKEYVSLLSSGNNNYQYEQHGSNFDCMQPPLMRKQAPGILGATAGRGRGNPHFNIFVPP
ncbi:hypothetical protein MLD38_038453 [Melastoma candidum]|uniref:Uncharacterized protein n=1 Tax=Melastoma candidum TaxID=119954 RepID=A0ACB9KZ74_9MYRT|nr:hypothetical protein MLD38_038453 [Melastoma candidum]